MHISAKVTIFLQLIIISLVTIGVVSLFNPVSSSDVKGAVTEGNSTPLGGNGLQVREAIGDPTPLTTPIQGATGQPQQEAAGSLQKQSTQLLQPNAKTAELPQ